jgi:hypothetical protein
LPSGSYDECSARALVTTSKESPHKMTRTRLGLLGLLAAFAVFAVAAASASANDLCNQTKSTELEICAEKGGVAEEFASPEAGVLGNPDATAVTSKLISKVGTVAVEIECSKAAFKDTLEDGATNSSMSKGEVSFTTCKVNKPAKGCEVVEPIKFTFVDEMPPKHADENERIGVEFWGPTGGPTKENEEFVTIHIKDKAPETCVIVVKEGEFKVTGSQWCTIDATNALATTPAPHHEVICAGKGSTGSELKFGVAEAEFVATFKEVEPEPDSVWENWWVHEST